tara:strand:- start:1302 stop:1925 length:624 start_codon:yes stop_codon:yes gene_type:complete
MKFFKNDAPIVEDYERTRAELIQEGWLSKIYNVEKMRSVYDITDLGYQYYFAICMQVGYKQLFTGPKLAEGQTHGVIEDDIDLVREGFIIEGIDAMKLTPRAADYLYVLTDSHGKVVQATIKLKSGEKVKKDTNWGEKLGSGFASFMKGMQGVSKMAQQYDKASTKSTRSAWGSDNSNFPPKRTLGSKKRKKPTKKRTYKKRRYSKR